MDIKLPQCIAAGVASCYTDPSKSGHFQQLSKYQALLSAYEFTGLTLIDTEFSNPVPCFLNNRVIRADCGIK